MMISKLHDLAQSTMIADINDNNKNPKLRTYKLFKTDFHLEPYLNINLSKSLYQSIARFRLSSHNLHIELGRHKRPYVIAEQRLCKRCDKNIVEDEFHCLMVCENWSIIRSELFKIASKHIDNFYVLHSNVQFLRILTCKNSELNFALSKFLVVVLKTDNLI
jgi:hypothetical protein